MRDIYEGEGLMPVFWQFFTHLPVVEASAQAPPPPLAPPERRTVVECVSRQFHALARADGSGLAIVFVGVDAARPSSLKWWCLGVDPSVTPLRPFVAQLWPRPVAPRPPPERVIKVVRQVRDETGSWRVLAGAPRIVRRDETH